MDPKFQSSFIPKASVIGDNKPKEKLGIWGVVSVLVFTSSILFLGGVFAYKKITQNAVTGLQADIASEESNMDNVAINKIIDFDSKMKSIKSLIDNHVAVSQYFKLLESNTVSDVQFLNIKYSTTNGDATINMKGKASGYASIADQEAVLAKNPNIVSPVFDSFALDAQGGVDFNVKFRVKGDALRFNNLLKSGLPAVNTSTIVATTTITKTSTTTTKINTKNASSTISNL